MSNAESTIALVRNKRELRDRIQADPLLLGVARELLASIMAVSNLSDSVTDDLLSSCTHLFGPEWLLIGRNAAHSDVLNWPSRCDALAEAQATLEFVCRESGAPSCLLVVDVQNDFVSGTLALRDCPAHEDGAEVVPVVNQLRHGGFDLVVLTRDWHPPDHVSFIDNAAELQLAPESALPCEFQTVQLASGLRQMMWPRHCVHGSAGASFVAHLDVLSSDFVLNKGVRATLDSYSAFWDNGHVEETPLRALLEVLGITDVVVCGLAFDVCVGATAMHAADLGLRVTVARDGCRAVTQEGADATAAKLVSAGVRLLPAAAIIAARALPPVLPID